MKKEDFLYDLMQDVLSESTSMNIAIDYDEKFLLDNGIDPESATDWDFRLTYQHTNNYNETQFVVEVRPLKKEGKLHYKRVPATDDQMFWLAVHLMKCKAEDVAEDIVDLALNTNELRNQASNRMREEFSHYGK